MALKNNIDFRFENYRSNFILKKSKDIVIPEGWTWTCGRCSTVSELKSDHEQYCRKCGARLRIQDRYDDPEKPPQDKESVTLLGIAYVKLPTTGEDKG